MYVELDHEWQSSYTITMFNSSFKYISNQPVELNTVKSGKVLNTCTMYGDKCHCIVIGTTKRFILDNLRQHRRSKPKNVQTIIYLDKSNSAAHCIIQFYYVQAVFSANTFRVWPNYVEQDNRSCLAMQQYVILIRWNEKIPEIIVWKKLTDFIHGCNTCFQILHRFSTGSFLCFLS